MYKRTKRVDTATGKFTHRKIPKHELGGSLQGSRYRAPSDVLWKRGKFERESRFTLCFIR